MEGGIHTTIYFTVTADAPSTLPVDPTSIITVTAGALTCNAPLSQGYCRIDFRADGDYVLVAGYGGSHNWSASQSKPWDHHVVLFKVYYPVVRN
jgi:hypothetical protein